MQDTYLIPAVGFLRELDKVLRDHPNYGLDVKGTVGILAASVAPGEAEPLYDYFSDFLEDVFMEAMPEGLHPSSTYPLTPREKSIHEEFEQFRIKLMQLYEDFFMLTRRWVQHTGYDVSDFEDQVAYLHAEVVDGRFIRLRVECEI